MFWMEVNFISQLAHIEAMSSSKKVITREEWEKKLNAAKIRKEDMNKLVMNFQVTEGYVEAAQRFRTESGTEPDIDLATITDRMAVKKAVQYGNVEDAIDKVNDLNPELCLLRFVLILIWICELPCSTDHITKGGASPKIVRTLGIQSSKLPREMRIFVEDSSNTNVFGG